MSLGGDELLREILRNVLSLRDGQSKAAEWQSKADERLSRLEAHLQGPAGNGEPQPMAEQRVTSAPLAGSDGPAQLAAAPPAAELAVAAAPAAPALPAAPSAAPAGAAAAPARTWRRVQPQPVLPAAVPAQAAAEEEEAEGLAFSANPDRWEVIALPRRERGACNATRGCCQCLL